MTEHKTTKPGDFVELLVLDTATLFHKRIYPTDIVKEVIEKIETPIPGRLFNKQILHDVYRQIDSGRDPFIDLHDIVFWIDKFKIEDGKLWGQIRLADHPEVDPSKALNPTKLDEFVFSTLSTIHQSPVEMNSLITHFDLNFVVAILKSDPAATLVDKPTIAAHR